MFLGLLYKSSVVNRRYKSFSSVLRCYSIQQTTPKNASYWHNIGSEPLSYKTLGQCVDEAAEKFGDREALVSLHEGLRFSFKDIRDQSDKIAAGFNSIGLKPGDRLGIWMPNYSQWYLTMMAAAKAGLILVGLNPAYQVLEMKYCLQKVNIKGIVTQRQYGKQNFYDILVKLAPELQQSEPGNLQNAEFPHLKSIIIADKNDHKGTFKFQDIPSLATTSSIKEISTLKSTIEPDSPFNIQFTSGTTGQPKAACLSHFPLVNNGYFMGKRYRISEKHHKICVLVPFFHAFGMAATICPALQHGATLVSPSASYNATSSLEAIAKEKCTISHGTPTMYVDMISKQKELNYSLDSMEYAVTGGAACSPNLVKQILEELKVKEVRAAYGLTESTAVIFQTFPNDTIDKITDTVGHVQDHLEIKIIDNKGQVVPFGQSGELCIRGYVNMLGYWEDEEKTKEIYGRDKWLKTGDQFILHKNGYGSIIGRFKEMIIRGGENIFPKEIEDFLNTHPDILESHVIGVPSERLGEEICAFVRVDNGKKITRDIVKEFCKDRISHFKIPRYILQVDSFPKTVSGKIQKFKLKEIFLNV